MCINVAGSGSENEFTLTLGILHPPPPPPPPFHHTADSELGQVQRLLSGWHCSTLFFRNVFYLSFSFKQFANVSLNYWSPKTHKLASLATCAQQAD